MNDSNNSNPFLALFSNPAINSGQQSSSLFNELVEDVFLFSLKPNISRNGTNLVHLTELASALHPQVNFDENAAEQALLDHCVSLHDKVIDYLFQCYERYVRSTKDSSKDTDIIPTTIFRNAYLTLAQPDLFPDQDIIQQWINLLCGQRENAFLNRLLDGIINEETTVNELLFPLLTQLKAKLKRHHLLLSDYSDLDAVLALCLNPAVAESILNNSILKTDSSGRDHENTLMGSLFTCSCITDNQQSGEAFNFFENPSKSPSSVHAAMESNIGAALQRRSSKVYTIVYTLLKSSKAVHNLTRQWLGTILQ